MSQCLESIVEIIYNEEYNAEIYADEEVFETKEDDSISETSEDYKEKIHSKKPGVYINGKYFPIKGINFVFGTSADYKEDGLEGWPKGCGYSFLERQTHIEDGALEKMLKTMHDIGINTIRFWPQLVNYKKLKFQAQNQKTDGLGWEPPCNLDLLNKLLKKYNMWLMPDSPARWSTHPGEREIKNYMKLIFTKIDNILLGSLGNEIYGHFGDSAIPYQMKVNKWIKEAGEEVGKKIHTINVENMTNATPTALILRTDMARHTDVLGFNPYGYFHAGYWKRPVKRMITHTLKSLERGYGLYFGKLCPCYKYPSRKTLKLAKMMEEKGYKLTKKEKKLLISEKERKALISGVKVLDTLDKGLAKFIGALKLWNSDIGYKDLVHSQIKFAKKNKKILIITEMGAGHHNIGDCLVGNKKFDKSKSLDLRTEKAMKEQAIYYYRCFEHDIPHIKKGELAGDISWGTSFLFNPYNGEVIQPYLAKVLKHEFKKY